MRLPPFSCALRPFQATETLKPLTQNDAINKPTSQRTSAPLEISQPSNCLRRTCRKSELRSCLRIGCVGIFCSKQLGFHLSEAMFVSRKPASLSMDHGKIPSRRATVRLFGSSLGDMDIMNLGLFLKCAPPAFPPRPSADHIFTYTQVTQVTQRHGLAFWEDVCW